MCCAFIALPKWSFVVHVLFLHKLPILADPILLCVVHLLIFYPLQFCFITIQDISILYSNYTRTVNKILKNTNDGDKTFSFFFYIVLPPWILFVCLFFSRWNHTVSFPLRKKGITEIFSRQFHTFLKWNFIFCTDARWNNFFFRWRLTLTHIHRFIENIEWIAWEKKKTKRKVI